MAPVALLARAWVSWTAAVHVQCCGQRIMPPVGRVQPAAAGRSFLEGGRERPGTSLKPAWEVDGQGIRRWLRLPSLEPWVAASAAAA